VKIFPISGKLVRLEQIVCICSSVSTQVGCNGIIGTSKIRMRDDFENVFSQNVSRPWHGQHAQKHQQINLKLNGSRFKARISIIAIFREPPLKMQQKIKIRSSDSE